jgi:hypothetical protein
MYNDAPSTGYVEGSGTICAFSKGTMDGAVSYDHANALQSGVSQSMDNAHPSR